MNDQAKPVSRPWRTYLRFSVRGLIVIVMVIGGWLGWIVRSARIQRDAVAAIENAGGSVSYDWEWNNGKGIPGGTAWAPRWLVDLIGVDYFGHVTDVIPGMKNLSLLNLMSTKITDAGLAHLKGLTNLREVYLDDTRVTGSGERKRRSLPSLVVFSRNISVEDPRLAIDEY